MVQKLKHLKRYIPLTRDRDMPPYPQTLNKSIKGTGLVAGRAERMARCNVEKEMRRTRRKKLHKNLEARFQNVAHITQQNAHILIYSKSDIFCRGFVTCPHQVISQSLHRAKCLGKSQQLAKNRNNWHPSHSIATLAITSGRFPAVYLFLFKFF